MDRKSPTSRHNTPTSTNEGIPAPAVKRRVGLRNRVGVLDADDPPPSSDHRNPQATPLSLPSSPEISPDPAPAHEKRTSDPNFAATASKISVADDQPPMSDKKSPWAEKAPDIIDVPKRLPDAGPSGPSQVTMVSPAIKSTTKPSWQQLILSGNDKKTLIAISAVVMTICLIIVTALTQKNEAVTMTPEAPPKTVGVTPIQITAGTLNAFTNGAQHDPANFTPFENPTLVIACQKPPSPGKKEGFDIRHCLIFKK